MHPACNRISSIYFRIIYFTFVAVRQPVLQARFPMTCIAGTTLYFLFSTLYCFYTHLTFRGNQDLLCNRFVWDLGFLAIIPFYTPSLGRSHSGPEPHPDMRQCQHMFIQSHLYTKNIFSPVYFTSPISLFAFPTHDTHPLLIILSSLYPISGFLSFWFTASFSYTWPSQ